MKRILWLMLFVLVPALPLFAQDQTAQDPAPASPSIKLVAVTLLVKDYEEAGKWYSENLGFEVRDNKDPKPERRWAAMWSKDDPSFQIFLHKPGNGYMPVAKNLSPDRVGKETFWILRTNDYDSMIARLKEKGVSFRSEMYPMPGGGKEIVFEDLYGNLWVLQQVGKK